MAISFKVPAQFAGSVASGELVRYGAILKHAGTGQVVGHLKEVGPLAAMASFNPPVAAAASVAKVAGFAYNARQLHDIKAMLSRLQMIGGLSLGVNVVSLGVNVIGFAAVFAKLKAIETRVMDKISKVQSSVDAIGADLRRSRDSDLNTAFEQLKLSERASSWRRKNELATDSLNKLHSLRSFYGLLINDVLWGNGLCSFEESRDLHSRFLVVCQTELQAAYLVGDHGEWLERHALIVKQAESVVQTESSSILDRSRKRLGIDQADRLKQTVSDCQNLAMFNIEGVRRLATANIEAEYIAERNIGYLDYSRELKEADAGSGLILVEHAD